MAVKAHNCFTVKCDVCEENYASDRDADFTIHFDSEADGLGTAEDSDWHTLPSGAAICDNGNEDHVQAIRAMHADMDPDHYCWIIGADEYDAGSAEAVTS